MSVKQTCMDLEGTGQKRDVNIKSKFNFDCF